MCLKYFWSPITTICSYYESYAKATFRSSQILFPRLAMAIRSPSKDLTTWVSQLWSHKRLAIHRGWKIHPGEMWIYFLILHRDLQLCLFSDLEQLEQPTFLICKECPNLTSVGSIQKAFKKKCNTPSLFNPYGVSSTWKVSPAHVNRVWLGYTTISHMKRWFTKKNNVQPSDRILMDSYRFSAPKPEFLQDGALHKTLLQRWELFLFCKK